MRLVSVIHIPATDHLISATDYATVQGNTLYVAYGGANALLAIDTSMQAVSTFAEGMTGVHGVAFSVDPALAFASLGGKAASCLHGEPAGSITVVEASHAGSYRPIDSEQTAAGGHTVAVDPQTHRVYVVCAGLHGAQVLVYEPIIP